MSAMAATVLLVVRRGGCARPSRTASRRSSVAAFGAETSQAAAQVPETFIQQARRALARGRPAEAEALAKARPAGDSDAAAVLARVEVGARPIRRSAATAPGGRGGQSVGRSRARAGIAAAASVRPQRGRSRAPQSRPRRGVCRLRTARRCSAPRARRTRSAACGTSKPCSARSARSTRSGGRNRVGRGVARDRQRGRGAEVVPAGHQARRRLGARAPWRRANARRRESAGGRRRGRGGPQDRRRVRRRASVPRRASSSTTRATTPRASGSTACSRPTPRISMRARCSAPSPTSATTSRRSRPRWRACSPSTRPSARCIASPAIWRRVSIDSTRRSR